MRCTSDRLDQLMSLAGTADFEDGGAGDIRIATHTRVGSCGFHERRTSLHLVSAAPENRPGGPQGDPGLRQHRYRSDRGHDARYGG